MAVDKVLHGWRARPTHVDEVDKAALMCDDEQLAQALNMLIEKYLQPQVDELFHASACLSHNVLGCCGVVVVNPNFTSDVPLRHCIAGGWNSGAGGGSGSCGLCCFLWLLLLFLLLLLLLL